MQRRRIRPMILGRDGAGKSQFLRTFPKPLLVMLWDAPDKAAPFLEAGRAKDIEAGKYSLFQDVLSSKSDDLIIRVEFWGEGNPTNPTSYSRFISRTASLESEIKSQGWATVGLDSVTGFELGARFYSEYNLNKTNPDGRAHYGFSNRACEQFIMTRWPNLIATNAVVIGHYDEQRDESDDGTTVVMRKMISMPGKLPNRVGTQFAEVWRVYIDEKGNRLVQTTARPGVAFTCKSALHFPDPSWPNYEALWKGLEDREGKEVKESAI